MKYSCLPLIPLITKQTFLYNETIYEKRFDTSCRNNSNGNWSQQYVRFSGRGYYYRE